MTLTRLSPPLALLAVTALLVSRPVHAASPPPAPALKSVTVSLPVGKEAFPGGGDAAPANANCLTCHSAAMVLTQPPLSKATWEAEVRKMITVYKAPIADADVPAIVAYLVKVKGAN